MSCSSFPELPTLIKISPSNIWLEKVSEETSWRPYGVSSVGVLILLLIFFEKLTLVFPAVGKNGTLLLLHETGKIITHFKLNEDTLKLGM